jgi:hypothetical protein
LAMPCKVLWDIRSLQLTICPSTYTGSGGRDLKGTKQNPKNVGPLALFYVSVLMKYERSFGLRLRAQIRPLTTPSTEHYRYDRQARLNDDR